MSDELYRKSWCKICVWNGTAGDLIAGSQIGGVRCPKCNSDDVYVGEPMSDNDRAENLLSQIKTIN